MFYILINTRCYYARWSISCWKRSFQLHNFLWLNIRTNSQFNSKLPNKWNYNFSTLCLRFKIRLHNSTRFLWNPSTEDWPDEKYKIILLADFNAKVGQTFRLLKKQVVGQHSLGKTNYRELRVLQFCVPNILVITNILVKYNPKPSRLVTWILPGGDKINQIDFIIVKQYWKRNIKNDCLFYQADIGSNHSFFRAKALLHVKPPKYTKRKPHAFDGFKVIHNTNITKKTWDSNSRRVWTTDGIK